MEKKAVVRAGYTPTCMLNTKQGLIKNGDASQLKEQDYICDEEKSLAKKMSALYNSGNDAAENN